MVSTLGFMFHDADQLYDVLSQDLLLLKPVRIGKTLTVYDPSRDLANEVNISHKSERCLRPCF